MNKNIIKIVTIIMIMISVLSVCLPVVFATTSGSGLVGKFKGDTNTSLTTENVASGSGLVGEFKGDTDTSLTTENVDGKIKKIIGVILSFIRIIAIGIAIIVITYLGIKYMSAAPNEKANIKNQLITFTIGAVLVLSATAILDKVHSAVTSLTK